MISTVVGWILLAGGLGGAVWASYSLWQAMRSEEWPRTAGEVLRSDIEESRDSDGMLMYRAQVAYKYRIGSRELTGTRVFFGDSLKVSWSGPASRLASKYKPGATVMVAYDPVKPAVAVLEPGANWQTYGALALCLLVAAAGAAVVFHLVPM